MDTDSISDRLIFMEEYVHVFLRQIATTFHDLRRIHENEIDPEQRVRIDRALAEIIVAEGQADQLRRSIDAAVDQLIGRRLERRKLIQDDA